MTDKISFAVIVSIDSSKRMGASSVYGVSEFVHCIKKGAEERGYRFNAGFPSSMMSLEIKPEQCDVLIDLSPKD